MAIEALEKFLDLVSKEERLQAAVQEAEDVSAFLRLAHSCGYSIRFADVVKFQASELLAQNNFQSLSALNDWGWIVKRGQPLGSWSEVMYDLLKKQVNTRQAACS